MKPTVQSLTSPVLAALLLGAGIGELPAQGTSSEPSYTRLVSNDSVYLAQPSMSPDGRWIAYSQLDTPNESSLWLVAARGGTPQRLTTRGQFDDGPHWISNDRIVFTSNRPARGEPKSYGMVLQIDHASGRVTAPPRQVTLDPLWGSVRPSPDGRSLMYITRSSDRFAMKVIPVQGGNARVLFESDVIIAVPTWSADGHSILFVQRIPGSTERAVLQISAQGGQPTQLFRTADWVRAIAPQGHVVTTPFGGAATSMTLRDRSGRELATMPLRRNTRPVAFRADGRALVMLHDQTVAPMRVVPLQGGAVRTISDADDYHWPIAFAANRSAVLSEVVSGEQTAIVVSPLAGGTPRRIVIPGDRVQSHGYAAGLFAYARPIPSSDLYRLFAFDPQSGRETLLSDRVLHGNIFRVSGPGGEWRIDDQFLFLERRGERVEVRAAAPGGTSRFIRAVPPATVSRTEYAVHGERVAWWEARGDSSYLMLADDAAAQPRAVLGAAGSFTGTPEIAWSWDGRRIASVWPPDQARNTQRLMIIDVPRPGSRAVPRAIETEALYFYFPKWLPDDSGLVMVAGYGMGVQSHILHVPLAEGARPVIVTRDDPSLKWGFELSADGRLVTYPGEIPRGSAILLADVGAQLRAASAATW